MVQKHVWMFTCVAMLAAVAVASISMTQVEARYPVATQGICGTQPPSIDTLIKLEKQHESMQGVDNPVEIPVVFHVINRGTGVQNGDVPDSMLIAQINALNNAFSGGAGGSNTAFRFVLNGITRTTDESWYTAAYHSAEEYEMKEALRQGGAGMLNIYTTNSPWNWSAFPWLYATAPLHDGVVIRHETMPGGASQYFGTGDIGVHEVGHWLGLYHTYQGECTDDNDFVADTPAMKAGGPQSCAPPRDTCKGKKFSGNDPLNNYMTGTVDACMTQFTAGQASRMSTMWAAYRQ